MQDGARTHRQQAALAASLTSLPLKFPVQEPPTKIALIAYTTRPCDESHKMLLQRIYTLSPVDDAASGDPAAILAYQGAQTRVLDDGDAKGASDALFDAIGKLDQADYRHILLLSHDYGNRRRGRASARHAPHASAAFFKRLAENHPDVCFYPLRRDIFPAIRLRRRNKQEESAYEIADYKSHSLLQKAIGGAMLRALLPIYSFATLDLVGREDHRPYSGICCYFFDTVTADEQPVTAEVARQNILGVGIGPHIAIRKSIISLLRGLHFLESEKPGVNGDLLLPVLDPLDWATPITLTAFGEIQLDLSRRKKARLSTAALLSQVANILARDDYKP